MIDEKIKPKGKTLSCISVLLYYEKGKKEKPN